MDLYHGSLSWIYTRNGCILVCSRLRVCAAVAPISQASQMICGQQSAHPQRGAAVDEADAAGVAQRVAARQHRQLSGQRVLAHWAHLRLPVCSHAGVLVTVKCTIQKLNCCIAGTASSAGSASWPPEHTSASLFATGSHQELQQHAPRCAISVHPML